MYLPGVVADATSSESLFLEDQLFVEIATLLLVRSAKVEIAAAEIAVADDVVDDEVEGAFLFTCVAVGQVLGVDHILADEEPSSSKQLAFGRLADIEGNVVRETLLKQEHLIG